MNYLLMIYSDVHALVDVAFLLYLSEVSSCSVTGQQEQELIFSLIIFQWCSMSY